MQKYAQQPLSESSNVQTDIDAEWRFTLDFDAMHTRAEAQEATGQVYDHAEVMHWAQGYASRLVRRRSR